MVACSGLTRQPVPIDQISEAEIAGMPGVRGFWSTTGNNPQFQQDIIRSIHDEPAGLFPREGESSPSYSGLALSGGGSNGAFGAGILYGWSEAGTRPVFKLVTGISTGALIAPYAFAGKTYDEKLRTIYTTVSTKDIAKISKRPPWRAEALEDTAPLAKLIARDVNSAMLDDIAAAHARGQRLYIGTTNLDAQRLVVWNMGAIASSGHPNALELFKKIMLASASIPGAFPPVYIDVEAGGQTYDEMHVDGGVITQVFFYEFMLNIGKAIEAVYGSAETSHSSAIYVIRNGKVGPEPEQISRDLIAITGRALSSMTKSAAMSDLHRIYQFTKRDQIDFNYAGIPDNFEYESEETFDKGEMNRLFDLGRQKALDDTAWHKSPFQE